MYQEKEGSTPFHEKDSHHRRDVERSDSEGWNPMARDIVSGIGAGASATAVLWAMMILTQGTVPQLEIITLLDHVGRGLAEVSAFPHIPLAGWFLCFFIDTVWWGAVFGLMAPILPGKAYWAKGLWFGFATALLVMLMVMPLSGAGYFGMALSPFDPLGSLLFHLVYGAVLGTVYGQFFSEGGRAVSFSCIKILEWHRRAIQVDRQPPLCGPIPDADLKYGYS